MRANEYQCLTREDKDTVAEAVNYRRERWPTFTTYPNRRSAVDRITLAFTPTEEVLAALEYVNGKKPLYGNYYWLARRIRAQPVFTQHADIITP